jgi:hypothetical protein
MHLRGRVGQIARETERSREVFLWLLEEIQWTREREFSLVMDG